MTNKERVLLIGGLVGGIAGGGLLVGTADRAFQPRNADVTGSMPPGTVVPGAFQTMGPEASASGVVVSFPPATEAPTASPMSSQSAEGKCAIPQNPNLGAEIGASIPVPGDLSQIQVSSLTNYQEGQWFYPIYDQFTANAANNWRGIGPHYPVAFNNLDANAGSLESHGLPGELIVRGNQGGLVALSLGVEYAHRSDGAWGHDSSGNLIQNPKWEMQFTLKGMLPGQMVWMVDADTGKQLEWPDGSPVIYTPSKLGDLSIEMPNSAQGECKTDTRVQLVFKLQSINGQPQEIKVERGPNDHPELKGENPLPDGVVKPVIPGN